jgi:hypothetical protein
VKLVIAVVVVLGACSRGGDGAPPCATVAARFFQIARDELGRAEADDATRRAVSDQLPAMRDALTTACSEGEWPAAVRSCLADAADYQAFVACEGGLGSAARAALDKAARGETGSD